jgi:cell division protein FtsN
MTLQASRPRARTPGRRKQARVTPPAQTAIISAKVGGLITIGTYGTRDEAEVVQGLLASAGIEASIRADDAGGAFPFVLSGGAQVLVDKSDAAAASELLANRADET